MTKTNTVRVMKRWVIFNKNTGNHIRSYDTREAARLSKRPFERIYDGYNGVFVR